MDMHARAYDQIKQMFRIQILQVTWVCVWRGREEEPYHWSA